MNTLCSWIAAIEQATTRIRDLKEKKKKKKLSNKLALSSHFIFKPFFILRAKITTIEANQSKANRNRMPNQNQKQNNGFVLYWY